MLFIGLKRILTLFTALQNKTTPIIHANNEGFQGVNARLVYHSAALKDEIL
jgi:hypothetical protein